ncbi:MAG TPA: MMPL family transporter [Myxococcota bacterium]|nr:MMPL family transporter [Myxococcota bacterium]
MYAWVARLFRRYLDLAQRRPWLLLAIIAVITTGLFLYGAKLKVRGDLEDLFPEDTPAVQRAQETRRLLGNTQELRVLIGSQDRELNRRIAEQVAAFAAARPDVSRVDFRRDVSFFEKNGILFVSVEDLHELEQQVTDAIAEAVKSDLGLDEGFEDEEEEPADKKAGDTDSPEEATSKLPTVEEVKKKHKVEGFNEFFESPDGEVIGVKIYPKFRATDATKTEVLNAALESELNRLIAPHTQAGVSWVMDGDYSQITRAAAQITNDMAVSGIWSLVGIALVVIVFFRRVRALLVVLLVLGISTAWMMAFAQLSVGYLNLVTSIIFAILFGMGVDFVIHALARVDEEHRHGVDLDTAVSRGFLGLARPVFNAMLTTAVTFWALIVFDFRGFSQLGLIAGFGVAFALLALYLLYPPLANAMNRIWKVKPRKQPLAFVESETAEDQGGDGHSHVGGLAASPPVSRGKKRLAWAIVLVVVGLGGVSAFLASELPFDSDMGKFRVKDNQAENTLKKKYREAETRSASPVLIVTKDLAETQRAHRHLSANLERYPIVNELSSVFTFIPEQQDDKLAIVKEIKRKIDNKYGALEGQTKADADELRRYEPTAFGPEDLPDWVRARFTDTEGRFGRYLLLFTKGQKSDALVALETFRQVGTVTLPAEGDLPAVELTSSASFYISGEAYAIVKREGPWAAIIGLVVVVFVVLFDFRSPRELLMILSPILSGFSITLGLMTLLGLPLDLFNVVVLPQIFGIGIDTGTHLTHRIKEGGPHVVQNVRATAVAAGISSSLTAIGFASLLPVSNAGLQSIGLLAVMGIGISYVVNVLMFTAFQWILRPRAA